MDSVGGLVVNGAVVPDQPVNDREGQRVVITFVERSSLANTPLLDEIVAIAVALGPDRGIYAPPTKSLAELLARVADEESIDSAEWDRQWAVIESEIAARDLADDLAEGRG